MMSKLVIAEKPSVAGSICRKKLVKHMKGEGSEVDTSGLFSVEVE